MATYLRFDTVKARGKTAYKPTNDAAETIVGFTTKKTFNGEQLEKLRAAGHKILLDGAPDPVTTSEPQNAIADALGSIEPSKADCPEKKLQKVKESGKTLTNRQRRYLKHKLNSDRELVI